MDTMPLRKPIPAEGPDVLTISEAAQALGVSEVTLRRWEKARKVVCHRHPVTGWRLFKRAEVLKLRKLIEDGRAA